MAWVGDFTCAGRLGWSCVRLGLVHEGTARAVGDGSASSERTARTVARVCSDLWPGWMELQRWHTRRPMEIVGYATTFDFDRITCGGWRNANGDWLGFDDDARTLRQGRRRGSASQTTRWRWLLTRADADDSSRWIACLTKPAAQRTISRLGLIATIDGSQAAATAAIETRVFKVSLSYLRKKMVKNHHASQYSN